MLPSLVIIGTTGEFDHSYSALSAVHFLHVLRSAPKLVAADN